MAEDNASSYKLEAQVEARRMVESSGRGWTEDGKLRSSKWRRQRQFPKRIIEWRIEQEADWAIDSIKKQREPNTYAARREGAAIAPKQWLLLTDSTQRGII